MKTSTYLILLSTTLFSLNTSLLKAQCTNNLLTNGSFTGPVGEAFTVPGWVSTITPDTNDPNGPLHCTPGYNWTGIPLASPDGGTWQNLFSDVETVSQTVTLTAGGSYTLCFQYAAQGITAGSLTYSDPVGLNVYLNNVLAFTTPNDTSQFTWESTCFGFTAPANFVTILFEPTTTNYIALDGACLLSETGINENMNNITVYSTLITDEFTVSSVNGEAKEIVLYDVNSRLIRKAQFNNSVTLNTSYLNKGVYFYEVINKASVIKKGKVMKQ